MNPCIVTCGKGELSSVGSIDLLRVWLKGCVWTPVTVADALVLSPAVRAISASPLGCVCVCVRGRETRGIEEGRCVYLSLTHTHAWRVSVCVWFLQWAGP